MSAAEEKKFVMKYIYSDFTITSNTCKNYPGKKENHFNILWKSSQNRYADGSVHHYVTCAKHLGEDDWSIETETEVRLVSSTGERFCKAKTHRYSKHDVINIISFSSADVEKYLVDGELTVEMHVKITKMEGIRTEKFRNFDESTKEFSDVVLMVDGEKFYVMKLYLASHSSYFKSLLFGNFDESKQSEIALSGINRWDFQNFLEAIHGEPVVDEDTVEGILHLADMYDSKAAIRQCEKFLMENSEQSLQMKFETAVKFKMDKLRKKCLSETKSRDDVISLAPKDAEQMEKAGWVELFNKLASFK